MNNSPAQHFFKTSFPVPVGPTDFCGNTLNFIQIGDQYWTTQEFTCTNFYNGDAIPLKSTTNGGCSGTFDTATSSAYTVQSGKKFYNGYCFTDARELIDTSNGWRKPTNADFDKLIAFVNDGGAKSYRLKSVGYPVTGGSTPGTNELGWNGVTGLVACGADFTTTFYGNVSTQTLQFGQANNIIQRSSGSSTIGYFVRFVKDNV